MQLPSEEQIKKEVDEIFERFFGRETKKLKKAMSHQDHIDQAWDNGYNAALSKFEDELKELRQLANKLVAMIDPLRKRIKELESNDSKEVVRLKRLLARKSWQ